jgi:hypothetical protein
MPPTAEAPSMAMSNHTIKAGRVFGIIIEVKIQDTRYKVQGKRMLRRRLFVSFIFPLFPVIP